MNREKKKIHVNKYKELISFISEADLDKLAEEVEVDYKVKKLKGKYMFTLLLYSILENNRASLRTMETAYNGLFGDTTAHSSLQDRLSKVSPEFFRRIFKSVVEKAKLKLRPSDIEIVDGTTICASANLFNLGIFHKNKNAKKANRLLRYTILVGQGIPQDVEPSFQAKGSSDDTTFPSIIRKNTISKETIAVFDRGMRTRKTYQEFTDENIHFVSRIKDNAKVEVIETRVESQKIKNSDDTLTDQLVYVFGRREHRVRVRLITIHTAQGKLVRIITNLWDKDPIQIAEIYRQRWSIEVFFRFIKQELNFKHFFGYTPNAILVSLYVIMIAAILLILYKHINKVSSFRYAQKAFIEDIRYFLMEPIVTHCGGDPALIDSYRKNHPHIFCFYQKKAI